MALSNLLSVGLLLLPLTITPVDGGGEADLPEQQPQVQTATPDPSASDWHSALLLACSDLMHTTATHAVVVCADEYVGEIQRANNKPRLPDTETPKR